MDGVEAIVEQLTAALEPKQEILEAYLFGSWARGEARANSDVDVTVYVEPDALDQPGWGYDAELTTDLIAALSSNRVDVVVLNRAPPMLYHRVLRDGRRLLSRDLAATTRRAGQALSRYFDYLPQLAKIAVAQDERFRRGEFGK